MALINKRRLLVSMKKYIIDVDISEYLHDLENASEETQQLKTVTLTRENIKIILVDPDYRFINFIDIGFDKEAMLLENRHDSQLRFFAPTIDQD